MMLNKRLIVLILSALSCCIFADNVYSQGQVILVPYGPHDFVRTRYYKELSEFDKCSYRIIYDYKFAIDTVKRETYYDRMLLEIGEYYSHYRSRYAEICDSMMSVPADPTKKTSVHEDGRNPFEWMSGQQAANYIDIFWDYPRKGIITVDEPVYKRYTYEEPIPEMDWEMLPGSVDILGYPCMKATVKFRGREWIAWFTPNIPISLGPWKFNGLPGMILRIEDSDGLFVWEAIGVENVRGEPMRKHSNAKYNKITREQMNKLFRMRWEDPASILGRWFIVIRDRPDEIIELGPGDAVSDYIPTIELE